MTVRFVDVFDTIGAMADIVRTGEWNKPEFTTRKAVT
jgi:kynureninase